MQYIESYQLISIAYYNSIKGLNQYGYSRGKVLPLDY